MGIQKSRVAIKLEGIVIDESITKRYLIWISILPETNIKITSFLESYNLKPQNYFIPFIAMKYHASKETILILP